jgi:uncharacterized protein with FMN-binding domain
VPTAETPSSKPDTKAVKTNAKPVKSVDTAYAVTTPAPASDSIVTSAPVIAATPAAPAPILPVPVPVAPAPVPPVQSADSPRAVAARAAADSAAKADSLKIGYKDGFYRGYGTSRHGDIEAEVEIKSGKIVYARISRCLTRYSCSWIDRLPDQVVARQSADVDYISGATQSSDAFYIAVTQALAKAK